MKNFKGLHKCAEGAIINTEDFMSSNALNTSTLDWPGRRNKNRHSGLVKQSKLARRNTPCTGSRCHKPNTH